MVKLFLFINRTLHEALIFLEPDSVILDVIQQTSSPCCETASRTVSTTPTPPRGNAALDVRNNLGQTALHVAVITDRPSLVRSLAQNGASLVLPDVSGDTGLHIACTLGHVRCVQCILEECTRRNDVKDILLKRNYAGLF